MYTKKTKQSVPLSLIPAFSISGIYLKLVAVKTFSVSCNRVISHILSDTMDEFYTSKSKDCKQILS